MSTLIVGGYGSVGRTISRELTTAADGPSRLYIAGRDGAKASAFAADLGGNVSGVAFDIRDTRSYAQVLKDVDQTVVCLDQSGTAFVEACLERGIDYVDVTASDECFRRIEALDDVARDTGATAMLSVGLAPGVTNLLAKRAIEQFSAVSAVRIGILLGLGEAFGPAASRWTLDRIGCEFSIGDGRSVKGFSQPRPMEFPVYGRRMAYRFDFADQHVLNRTLDIPTTTRLCFDSRVVTSAVYQLSRRGLYRPVAATVGIDHLTRLVSMLRIGGDGFVASVEVEGEMGSDPPLVTNAIVGSEQSRATGIVAAAVATTTPQESVPNGVHHIHEALDPKPIFSILRDRGYRFTSTEQLERAIRS